MSETMTPGELRDFLKPVQEKKGCFFNPDDTMTLDILEQLLNNKERFGYMACPCRLANGDYEADKDILCPCSYRLDDIAEFGACFCGLYVSPERHRGDAPEVYVPDRRPRNKIHL